MRLKGNKTDPSVITNQEPNRHSQLSLPLLFALIPSDAALLTSEGCPSLSLSLNRGFVHLHIGSQTLSLAPAAAKVHRTETDGILHFTLQDNGIIVLGFSSKVSSWGAFLDEFAGECSDLSESTFDAYMKIVREWDQVKDVVQELQRIESLEHVGLGLTQDTEISSNELPKKRKRGEEASEKERSESPNLSPTKTEGTVSEVDDDGPEGLPREGFVLTYPPSGINAVTLFKQDLARLKKGQFLNDTLIEFWIRYTINTHAPAPASDNFHVFNTFFYSQLMARDELNRKIPIETNYKRVHRWTRKVNLFTKRFLVVPINEQLHWYLAVVWNPGALLIPREGMAESSGCSVLIFDSLQGKHLMVGRTLMSYLRLEAFEKLGVVVERDLKVVNVKVQDQLNYCDCGLFLLHHFSLMIKRSEEVAQAALKGEPINTAAFGSLRDIRRMRTVIKSTIETIK